MLDLFLAVCLHTSLACADIRVDVIDTRYRDPHTKRWVTPEAMAYRTNLDRIGLRLSTKAARFSEEKLTGLFVHEVSHMVVWTEHDPLDGDHGRMFQQVCRDLAANVGVSRSNCRDIH